MALLVFMTGEKGRRVITSRQVTIAELSLRNRERDGLQGAARAWKKLKREEPPVLFGGS